MILTISSISVHFWHFVSTHVMQIISCFELNFIEIKSLRISLLNVSHLKTNSNLEHKQTLVLTFHNMFSTIISETDPESD